MFLHCVAFVCFFVYGNYRSPPLSQGPSLITILFLIFPLSQKSSLAADTSSWEEPQYLLDTGQYRHNTDTLSLLKRLCRVLRVNKYKYLPGNNLVLVKLQVLSLSCRVYLSLYLFFLLVLFLCLLAFDQDKITLPYL